MQTKSSSTDPLKRCYIITSAILLVGFGSAAAIYLTAGYYLIATGLEAVPKYAQREVLSDFFRVNEEGRAFAGLKAGRYWLTVSAR